MKRLILQAIFVFFTLFSFGQSHKLAILDLCLRNGESNKENLASAIQMAEVAGMPYLITTNVVEAISNPFILLTSPLSDATLQAGEILQLSNFVTNGGVLVASYISSSAYYNLFGISNSSNNSNRYKLIWDVNSNHPELSWINDDLEKELPLARTDYIRSIYSRGYTNSTAVKLASFEDQTAAVTVNNFGSGKAYAFGFELKDVILRNLLNKDYNAERSWSNGFEPTTDVFFLFLRAIYTSNQAISIYKHTSPGMSTSALLITHDVDSRTGMDSMYYFSEWEANNNIKAHYFVTTHYVHDDQMSAFYDSESIPKIKSLLDHGHGIGSHSVGHFPDFASLSIFPIGISGNTVENYRPEYLVDHTVGGTVTGELEVSRDLLINDIGANVRSFRSGYLAFSLRLTNVMSDLNYSFNSTNSANDVLTNFPYFQRTNEAFSGVQTNVLEIPMTISDASKTLKLEEETMDIVVPNWVDILKKNNDNNAPTILLIHPNRGWKLEALKRLIDQKPASVITYEFNAYGDYWIERGSLDFNYSINDNNLSINLANDNSIGEAQSIVISNGRNLNSVKLYNHSGESLSFQTENWKENDIIITQIGASVIIEPSPKQYTLIINSKDENLENLNNVSWEVLSADSTLIGSGNTGSNALDTLKFTNTNSNLEIILKTNKSEYTDYRVVTNISSEQNVLKTTTNSLLTYLFKLSVTAKDSETGVALDSIKAKAFLDGVLIMQGESLENTVASLETNHSGHSLNLKIIIERSGYIVSESISLNINEGQANSLIYNLIRETPVPKQYILIINSKDENSQNLNNVNWEVLNADSTLIGSGNTGSNALDTLQFTNTNSNLEIILKSKKTEYSDYRVVTSITAGQEVVKTTTNSLLTYLFKLDLTAEDNETGALLDYFKASAFLNGILLMEGESLENSIASLETNYVGHSLDLQIIIEKSGYITSYPISLTINENKANSLTINLIKEPVINPSGTEYTHRIAIWDNTTQNNEPDKENLTSTIQMADVAGIPYTITYDLDSSTKMAFILITSSLKEETLTSDQVEILKSYVQNGGVLIAPFIKNPALFDLFGISSTKLGNARYSIKWKDKKIKELKWIDDPLEKNIPLADPNYNKSINTRGYEISSAETLAEFEDKTVAVSRNEFGLGKAYAFGVEWKDVILRNLLDKDYNAQRTYSNGFEPTSDVFMLVLRAIFTANQEVSVYKHTSPGESTSALLITHDVDSRTIIDAMNIFSNWEFIQEISAHYFVTTHYIKDAQMSLYYEDSKFEKIHELLDRNHTIGSHSVSHAPDFFKISVFPMGSPGNTKYTYQPSYNGSYTTGGTVYGELEVSRDLLNNDIGANVRSFRAGELSFNPRLVNVMDNLGYAFNSSESANNVLTNFPFMQRTNKAFSGQPANILEIPLTITDASSIIKLESTNITEVVKIWEDVIKANNKNNAPTVLLISPNREWKLEALQSLLSKVPNGVITYNFEDFGDFWLDRQTLDFDYFLSDHNLEIKLKSNIIPAEDLSLIIENANELNNIKVITQNGNNVPFNEKKREGHDLLISFGQQSQSNQNKRSALIDVPTLIAESKFNLFPNPAREFVNLLFDMKAKEEYKIRILDMSGRQVFAYEGIAEEGSSMHRIDLSSYTRGLYIINFESATVSESLKLSITE